MDLILPVGKILPGLSKCQALASSPLVSHRALSSEPSSSPCTPPHLDQSSPPMASPTTATLTTHSCTCRSPRLIRGSQLGSVISAWMSKHHLQLNLAKTTSRHPGQTLYLPRSLNHPGICHGGIFILCQEPKGLQWKTSSPSLPTFGRAPGRVDSPSTTSGRSGDTIPPSC